MVVALERRSTSTAPGSLAVLSGAVGVVLAVLQLVLPTTVAADRFSAPFSPAVFTACAVVLFLAHLAAVPATVAVARGTGTRLGATGGAIASIGTVGLAVAELVSIVAAHERGETPVTDAVGAGYGPGTVAVGLGMILLGVAVLRTRQRTGALPLVIGIFTFVPLLPAVAVGAPFAMLALAAWSALYLALGWSLVRGAPSAGSR